MTYELWLAPLAPARIDGCRVVVLAPDEGRRRWVSERFGRLLTACAAAVLGPDATVEVALADEQEDAVPSAADAGGRRVAARADLNPKLRFDQFVIGEHNRLAHAAALTVAELPGTAYNPLFVYGPPGVGKTHLLQSIAAYVMDTAPELTVHCTTAERFTNQFRAALQAGDTHGFKDVYRSTDVLLIDDVQFLERKARTEEEFFHTFNALHENGAQIVLTSDRTPGDLQALEERLRERFEAGLVTDIRPPDLATRLTVLRKRAALDDVGELPEEVLVAIAERVEHNVRALEGALIGLVAFASLTGRPLDVELVEGRLGGGPAGRLAGEVPRRPRGKPTVAEVRDLVCAHFGVGAQELVAPGRTARLAWPRQVAMHLVRQEVGASLPAIGAAFGGRSHTTVLHAVRRTAERVQTDPEAAEDVRALTALLRADRTG